jgi:hypothetical protein
MVTALLFVVSAVLAGGCALGVLIHGVSAHLEADDQPSAPRIRW